MKKSSLIILIVAMSLVLVGGIYFLGNMNEDNQEELVPDEQDYTEGSELEEPTETEEPTEVEEPTESEESTTTTNHDGSLDHEHFEIEMGKRAPDFTLLDLEGNETRLSDYSGKLVFLNYWATWCPYCVEEMPDLQKMHEENDDLVVIGVNVRESKEQAQDFMTEGGFDFPVMLDEDGHIASLYLVNAMPSTFFLNSEGIIIGYQPGMMNLEQMEDLLEQMRELEGQL